jgi:uncharacterized protein (DUF433 family)
MKLPDFLNTDQYGEIFLTGHRITLYHVLGSYEAGGSVDALAAAYPTLSRELVDKVLTFYLQNKADVDQYLEQTRVEIERQAVSPARGPSMAELQRRLAAGRRAESA